MRTPLLATLLGWLLLVVPAQADEAKEARDLLDRAIKAMGGKDKLTRYQAATWKSKGKVHAGEEMIDFTDEWSVQGLAQYRWAVEATSMGQTRSFTLVLNKDKGWVKNNQNEAQDLRKQKEVMTIVQTELRVVRLAQRLVPLTDKDYRLSHLGELKIDGKDAVGIKAVRKGQPDIDLFFDKKTCLPLRSEVRVKEPGGSEEVLHAWYYGKYQEAEGVKHFTTIELRRDDKVLVELELSDVRPQEQLGDETFDKP
jgi:hypothetical protein